MLIKSSLALEQKKNFPTQVTLSHKLGMSDSPSRPRHPFEPVFFVRRRHDGWTPERQSLFIEILGRIGVVTVAAQAVGMSRKSAYALLKRAGPESSFADAWEQAQASGRMSVWSKTVIRALDGVEEPYFYGGLQRGTRRVYDDRLLIALFRATQREQAREEAERKRGR